MRTNVNAEDPLFFDLNVEVEEVIPKGKGGRKAKEPAVEGEDGWFDPKWESDVKFFGFNEKAARDILKVRNFRNEFRKKLRDQIVAWLNTPKEERKYHSPLSPRQWECIQPFRRNGYYF